MQGREVVLYRCINACECHVFHHIFFFFGNSPMQSRYETRLHE
jgi:hypothetical protein